VIEYYDVVKGEFVIVILMFGVLNFVMGIGGIVFFVGKLIYMVYDG